MSIIKFPWSFLIILGLATGTFWGVQSKDKPGALLHPQDQQIVAKGKALYAANCASCHGDELQGQDNWRSPDEDGFMPAPPHDKSGHSWHHTDELLFSLTKYGLGKMIGKKDYKTNMPIYDEVLSDEEIIAVLSYIKSRWPADIQDRHDQMNAMNAKDDQ